MDREIVFGQYYPKNSLVHKLDPRTKLLSGLLMIIVAFFAKSYYSYAVCYGFLAIVILASRIPLKSILKTVKAILVVLILTLILNIFFYKDGKPLVSWKFILITDEGLIYASKMALRVIFLVVSTSLITLTTTPMALTDGMESLMKPLKLIKFPVHDVALIMSIALRFIPTLMEEVDKITLAQRARGAHFDTGGLVKRAKALLPVLIPLFVGTFRRADELAMALDARCYNATPNRTKMKPLKFALRDAFAMLAVCAFFVVVVLFYAGVFGAFPI